MENYTIKHFSDLSAGELYQVLKLRNEIFIVEQNCPYQDLDGKDLYALHLLYYVDDQLAAYTRLLPAGLSYEEVSIGRVVCSEAHRGLGIGRKLMQASVEACYEHFGRSPVRIGAQLYLQQFYWSLGFENDGESYIEDGIPHVQMVKAG